MPRCNARGAGRRGRHAACHRQRPRPHTGPGRLDGRLAGRPSVGSSRHPIGRSCAQPVPDRTRVAALMGEALPTGALLVRGVLDADQGRRISPWDRPSERSGSPPTGAPTASTASCHRASERRCLGWAGGGAGRRSLSTPRPDRAGNRRPIGYPDHLRDRRQQRRRDLPLPPPGRVPRRIRTHFANTTRIWTWWPSPRHSGCQRHSVERRRADLRSHQAAHRKDPGCWWSGPTGSPMSTCTVSIIAAVGREAIGG